MVKPMRMLNSAIKSRWLLRNTIALSLNHHMTPEGALKQSLLVTVLVFVKSRGKDQNCLATWLRRWPQLGPKGLTTYRLIETA